MFYLIVIIALNILGILISIGLTNTEFDTKDEITGCMASFAAVLTIIEILCFWGLYNQVNTLIVIPAIVTGYSLVRTLMELPKIGQPIKKYTVARATFSVISGVVYIGLALTLASAG